MRWTKRLWDLWKLLTNTLTSETYRTQWITLVDEFNEGMVLIKIFDWY